MTAYRNVAPGFIELDGTRYAVSELKSWRDAQYNGRPAVELTTKDGHFRVVYGVFAADIDRLVARDS